MADDKKHLAPDLTDTERQFLADVREAGKTPRGPAETAAIEAARQFDGPRPIPKPKGGPTRSADRPPTGPKPKC